MTNTSTQFHEEEVEAKEEKEDATIIPLVMKNIILLKANNDGQKKCSANMITHLPKGK
jgi:hypothetical protein